MEKTISEQWADIENKIYLAERERDAWKGKATEHYKMADLLVAAYEKERAELLLKQK